MSVKRRFEDWLFSKVHLSSVVYNTCWEDPRCDKHMLRLNERSKVVMLTSAGCNALSYLLDEPAEIHCVDMNVRQNALLDLKLAFYRSGISYDALAGFFLNGRSPDYKKIYSLIAPYLSNPVYRKFWDRQIRLFQPGGLRRSFYWRGSSGTVAWLMLGYLRLRSGLYKNVQALLNANNLQTQQALFEKISPQLFTPVVNRLFNSHIIQSMLGVPRAQQRLTEKGQGFRMAAYAEERLRHVFTNVPVVDNYFYKVYLHGCYTATCCPDYLVPGNFRLLQALCARIYTHTKTLTDFLRAQPGQYTHFILLDHMDWLVDKHRVALEDEWREIFNNAAPNAKILFRSASKTPDFLPEWVLRRLRFDSQAASISDSLDRVGTYAGTFIATVLPESNLHETEAAAILNEISCGKS